MKITLFDSIEKAKEIIPSGEIRTLRIDMQKILVANHQDRFFAFEKNCPHMGHPLSDGRINPHGEIVCTLHTYRFDLNTGLEAEQRCRDLKRYPLTIEGGKLTIDL